jgi:hypothetical protein
VTLLPRIPRGCKLRRGLRRQPIARQFWRHSGLVPGAIGAPFREGRTGCVVGARGCIRWVRATGAHQVQTKIVARDRRGRCGGIAAGPVYGNRSEVIAMDRGHARVGDARQNSSLRRSGPSRFQPG